MKIRKNKSREKTKKSLFNSELAGATVIAAVLLLCIIFGVLAVVRIEHVPELKTDAEASHMRDVQSDMAELKSTVDLITLLTSDPYSSAYGFSVTVPVSLGGGEVPVLESSKSSGILSVNAEPCNITINAQKSTGPTQVLIKTLECGGITYQSNNRQYIDQILRYENGALILSQNNRSLMKQFPSFSIASDQNNKSNYTVSIQAINISGNSDTISSDTDVSLKVTGLNNTAVYDSTDSEGTSSFNFTIYTKYPDAWYSYFYEITEDAGLEQGDYKLIKNNFSDNGLCSVYFKFPTGNKSLERLYISNSTIQAELGAGSNFKDTGRIASSGTVKKQPVAGFSVDPMIGYAPLDIQITDKSQYAVNYTYDFGDGTPVVTEKEPKHTYTKSGKFTITQTVKNAYGTSSTSTTINILNAYAYITNYNSGTVSVIDTANNTVTATVNVETNPAGVAVAPDGAKVYVANEGSNSISVIDTATSNVISVGVGKWPYGVAVSPDGTRVYVTNEGSNSVSVIDTASNTVKATVDVGKWPFGIAVSPDGTKVYVANEGSSAVSIIDTTSNTITSVGVGKWPYGVAVSPDGTRVYVTNEGSDTVSVIDTASNTIKATVDVGKWPFGIAVNPEGTRVYIANEDASNVSVIDTASNNVIATVNVGNNPAGIAVNPAGTKVFVANKGSNTVSIIDTSTNNVTNNIIVGDEPIAFGQFIVPS